MKTLKFNHVYKKMEENTEMQVPKFATLLECFIKDSSMLHPRFIEYDTFYIDENNPSGNHYKLPDGKVIVLLLRSDLGGDESMLWTTIRKYTPEKYKMYNSARMEEFKIAIVDDKESDKK